jgi:osmotically-inducible protein OsmY
VEDDTLAQNVTAALLRDATLDGYELKVRARKGTVALTGTVDSFYEKSEAEDVASRATGALHVENGLTVVEPTLVYYDLGSDPYWAYLPSYSYWDAYRALNFAAWPYRGDAVVKDDLEDKLYWNPWVNLDGVSAKVVNGVATLTGNADNAFESNMATQDAFASGAQLVQNNVAVR